MDVVSSAKSMFKKSVVHIDNFICELHYRVTVIIVVTACAIISASQYIGSPIECIGHVKWSSSYVNTHCWLSHTYSVLDKDGKITQTHKEAAGVTVVNHAYYQWMPFYLVFVATSFYLPRLLWKNWEGGLMKCMVSGLEDRNLKDDDVVDKLETRVRYFTNKKTSHNGYLARFCVCELLYLINVILQFVLFDKFLGGKFFSYGTDAMSYFQDTNPLAINPMEKVFPLTTSCDMTWGGVTGEKEETSQQCLLSQNIINDKITLILWFWFVILTTVTCCSVLYRFAYCLVPTLAAIRLKGNSPLSKESSVNYIKHHCTLGDCWFLQQMSKNMHSEYMVMLISQIQEHLSASRDDSDNNESLLDTKC